MSTRINKPGQTAPEPRPRNRAALFGGGAAVLGVVAVAIWAGGKALMPETETSEAPETAQTSEPRPAVEAAPEDTDQADSRLFSESMLDDTGDEPEALAEEQVREEEPGVPFELEQVAYALSRVDVDENGDIVINETAQTVLEQAFFDARATMNEQQLEELKTMIEAGLGGQAGAQAVEIAEKFYRYSNAFREVSDTLAVRGDPGSLRDDYEQITRLRRTHLGPDLAEKLYGKEEQLTRYTLEVMELQADKDLTPEQLSEKQQELASRYKDVLPDGATDNDQEAGEQASN